jgi:hypothetical protein
MSEFIGILGQRVGGYIQNNLADFFARFGLSVVGLAFPSGAITESGQTFIRGLFVSSAARIEPGEDLLHYVRIVTPAVNALPIVMALGVGAAVLFVVIARGVAVLAVEGPQLRTWSRRLFRAGFMLAMGFVAWLVPANTFEPNELLQNPTRLGYTVGIFLGLALVYVLMFAAGYFAWMSPNVRVVAAPWPLRSVFRAITQATV